MTKEEAITILKDISWQMGSVKRWENIEAIDIAIEALSQESSEDVISRQAAIEAIEIVDWYHQNSNKDMVHGANDDEHQAWYKADDVYKALEAVPSAKAVPQSEQYKKGFEDAKRAFLVEYARESQNMRKRIAQLEVMLNAQKAISADRPRDEEDQLKFYYVESIDDYWIGMRIDNFYYADWHEGLGFVWSKSRYLPWGEHIVDENTLWKEHTYPSEPVEMQFTDWIVGFVKKYFADRPRGEWTLLTEERPVDGYEIIATVYWPGYGDSAIAVGHIDRFDNWHLYSPTEGALIKGFEVIAWKTLPEPYCGADMRGEDE